METRLNRIPSIEPGTIPQSVVVLGGLVFCFLVYSFSVGTGSGRYLESDRLVVAECWKSIDRRAASGMDRQSLVDGCERMERGFRLKHGATL